MPALSERTQIYLDDGQDERLRRLASSSGLTRSHLIREAIDAFLDAPGAGPERLARFRSAVDEVEHSPLSLPDGRSYVEQLRRRDALRRQELERRLRA